MEDENQGSDESGGQAAQDRRAEAAGTALLVPMKTDSDQMGQNI